MLFNSFEFLIFFPLVILVYFLLPHKYRWAHLLLASCLFYMAFIPVYIFILMFTIIIDYVAGILIEDANEKRKKLYLILSIIANIGVLAFFKYYNFFIDNMNVLLVGLNLENQVPFLNIILPLGLSFHTFQSLSYTIEVYRNKQKAERHVGIFALYVLFFPQLVAGPIERPQHLLSQFYIKREFEYARVTDGLKLMAWGFLKKLVIADGLGILVNRVYDSPQEYKGLTLIIATLFFSLQILYDFSGYSDIAIGSAKVMGIDLMKNFDEPYKSKNLAEFWKRWHISLSGWFRDYLYIPLGGNRVPVPKWYFNLLITFIISGLWHGPKWTFICWGAMHGLGLIFEIRTQKIKNYISGKIPDRWYSFMSVLFTFSFVSFTFIFFRASTFKDAVYIVRNLFKGSRNTLSDFYELLRASDMSVNDFFIPVCAAVIMLFFGEVIFRSIINNSKPVYYRWAIYLLLVTAILYGGVYERSEFIYFQF